MWYFQIMKPKKPQSPLFFVLKALMPYTRQNLLLSFNPNRFFNELEKISSYKRKTLEEAARRAEKQGLIEKQINRALRLTTLGERKVRPYFAEKLASGAKLMIVFDVPEDNAIARRQLRTLLKKWGFRQVQKSVWITSYDHRKSVELAVDELDIKRSVRLYECELLFPKN